MDTQEMAPRQQRGLQIAALCKLQKKGKKWIVPSQSGKGKYTVCPDPTNPHCTCPDHANTGDKCKHIFAVEFTIQRERNPDGSVTVTDAVKITERKTYPQKWTAYNAAQQHEKEKLQVLLHDLCRGIKETPQTNGRPRLSLADIVFATAFKVYTTFPGRRFMTDLWEAQKKGYLKKAPHYNSIFRYFDNKQLTPVLQSLIKQSSRPLWKIEKCFAADSTGFTGSRFTRYFDLKYHGARKEHDWVKLHIMCGVKTNIVTAVRIKDKNASDTKLLPEMLKDTAATFKIEEVSADKGYSSINNTNEVASHGAVPYICYKSHHKGTGGGLWEQMYYYFRLRHPEFMEHYHKRSNVETVFSAMKAKFRDHVRSKTPTAMVNEVLCKVLCHNICVLIQEMYELGVEPEFWTEKGDGEKVV